MGILKSLLFFDGIGVVFLSLHFTKHESLTSVPTRYILLPICPPARMNQFLPAALQALRDGDSTVCSGSCPTSPPTWSQELFDSHSITYILPEVEQPLLVLPLCLPHPHSRLDLGYMFKHLDSGRTCLTKVNGWRGKIMRTTRGGLGWILSKISSWKMWSGIGTGCPAK